MTSLASLANGSASTFLLITKAFASFMKMYELLIMLRLMFGYFPTFNWDAPPWRALRQVTNPYLNIFRGLVPPLGGMDMSLYIGFILLGFIQGVMMAPFENDP